MKITATKRDDLLKARNEYDAETNRLKGLEEESSNKWKSALYDQQKALENRIADMIGSTSLDLSINVDPYGYYGSKYWNMSVKANENKRYDRSQEDKVSLIWNWEIKMDKNGNIVKDSGSWSGLKAITMDQISDLEESVRVLKILNSTDWTEILNSPKAQWEDYMDEGLLDNIRDRKRNRPDFESDLQAAQLEDLIGSNTAIQLKQDQFYRGKVWILPTGLTDKFIKGYIFPDFYADRYSADEIREQLGDARRSSRSNIVTSGGELVTMDLA